MGELLLTLFAPVCCYEVVDVAALVGLLLQPFFILEVKTERDHLLATLPVLGVLLSYLFSWLF